MKTVVLLAIMSNLLLAGPDESVTPTISHLPSSTYLDVSYGSDPKQAMDIYLPGGRTAGSTKVLFLIHGGGWSGGDKRDFVPYVDSLKKYLTDYAFVNINYRLANFVSNKFPTQENDIKAALIFVMNRLASYSISQKVVLLGASAGAHLALLQAYKHADPVRPKAVVSFFGPGDMAYLYNHPANAQVPFLMQALIGGTPIDNPESYAQSSPIHFITNQTCPTLLLQGGKDHLVTPRQASLLKDKLQNAGVTTKLVVYPDEGHGWGGASLGDSFKKISDFLDHHVK